MSSSKVQITHFTNLKNVIKTTNLKNYFDCCRFYNLQTDKRFVLDVVYADRRPTPSFVPNKLVSLIGSERLAIMRSSDSPIIRLKFLQMQSFVVSVA